ncbi:MAG: hypothetical protein ABSA49_10895 [Rhizomicrobium sp.]
MDRRRAIKANTGRRQAIKGSMARRHPTKGHMADRRVNTPDMGTCTCLRN